MPSLINKTCKSLLSSPETMRDIRALILHGNEPLYLGIFANMLLKRLIGKDTLTTRKASYSYTNCNGTSIDVEYEYSDFHFEIKDYSEKHVKLISSIVSNKSINSKQFVFLIKGVSQTSKSSQLSLKQAIDYGSTCQYLFVTKTLSSIDTSILSRSVTINVSFPLANVYEVFCRVVSYKTEYDEEDDDVECKGMMTMEKFVTMYTEHTTNRNLLIMLIKHEHGGSEQCLFQALDKFLNKLEKHKNPLTSIALIREFTYKVYHLTIPLHVLCRYIINRYARHNYIGDIVSLAAKCDMECACGTRDILIYEQFFIKLLKIIS